jgi:hypothetical protein
MLKDGRTDDRWKEDGWSINWWGMIGPRIDGWIDGWIDEHWGCMLRKYTEDGWRVDGVFVDWGLINKGSTEEGWLMDGGWLEDVEGWSEYGLRIGQQGRLEDEVQAMAEGTNPQGGD